MSVSGDRVSNHLQSEHHGALYYPIKLFGLVVYISPSFVPIRPSWVHPLRLRIGLLGKDRIW